MSQHMDALDRANEIRIQRAELKRDILAGKQAVATVLTELPDCAATMTVSELLCSQHRWGRTRARKFLQPFSIFENKEVSSLTLRQRKLLSDELQRRGNGG